jgi:hypothetical protein
VSEGLRAILKTRSGKGTIPFAASCFSPGNHSGSLPSFPRSRQMSVYRKSEQCRRQHPDVNQRQTQLTDYA